MYRPFILALLALFLISPVFAQEADKLVEAGLKKAQNGNYDAAISDYSQALKLEPNNQNAFLQRAFAFIMKKDYTAGIGDYSQVLKMNPNNQYALISRGSAYNKMEKFELALKDFNRALEIDPKNEEAYNNRGWARKGLGDIAGACKDWKASKKLGNAEAKIILQNTKCK